MTHGNPPPLIPRSFTTPTADPVTGVIEWNSTSVPPSCAATPIVPTPTSVREPSAPTNSRRRSPLATTSVESSDNSDEYRRMFHSRACRGGFARFSHLKSLRGAKGGNQRDHDYRHVPHRKERRRDHHDGGRCRGCPDPDRRHRRQPDQ